MSEELEMTCGSETHIGLWEKVFASPRDEYIPIPWWAWTGALAPEQLERQLRLMCAQGLREFFIFPIYGMDIAFMSPEYIERIGQVVAWCKALGMKVWIYDELSWPSGTAAGLVPRRHPAAVARQLRYEECGEMTAAEVQSLLDDEDVVAVFELNGEEPPRLLAYDSIDFPDPCQVILFRRRRDETQNLTTRGCLWTRNEAGVLDLLSADAAAAFIEEAYAPIARAFPDELGVTIRGFFTDEPQFAPGTLPWCDGLPERFAARYGYELFPSLPALLRGCSDSARVRIDFWALVSEEASDAFTGQLACWCARHNLELTGHFLYEENSDSVWAHGDTPEHLLKLTIPGCDLLSLWTSFDERNDCYSSGAKSLVKTAKNPASAARFRGRRRVMCEAFGIIPWWKTAADEKRMTDWLAALGVNLINDNSLITDICDFRKRAIAGKHFTQPYWPYEHLFYAYAGRTCGLVAETLMDTEIMLLYPSSTWWAELEQPAATSSALRNLERAFDATADALVRKQWPFELLFEQVLDEATVKSGVLVTGHGEFRGIVIAGATRLRAAQAAKLEAFAASGGALFLVHSDAKVMTAEGERPLCVPGAEAVGDWESSAFPDKLSDMLARRVVRPWTVEGDCANEVISAARIDEDGNRYLFVANMTPGSKDLRISWREGGLAECWDPDTGRRWAPRQEPGRMRFTLPEGQSVWIAQTRKPCASEEAPAHFMPIDRSAVLLDGPWEFETDRPNLYRLDHRLRVDVGGTLDAARAQSEGDAWIDVACGDAGVPLRPEDMACYWLSAEFELLESCVDLQLIVDTSLFGNAWLNGVDLGESAPATVWDDHNRAWELGGRAHPGVNHLLLRATPSPYNAEHIAPFTTSIVEPIVLRGRFAVDGRGRLTTPPRQLGPGDWGAQGFPHFAGVGTYRMRFAWDGGDALIALEAGRHVAEVLVDGCSLDKRAWGARHFLAKDLGAGQHALEVRIANTLAGILRRSYGGETVADIPESGLLAPPRISHYRD